MTRIAYLASEYPAASHTFIRREIAALRKRGFTILPFSVRPSSVAADEDVPAILGRGMLSCIVGAALMFASSPRRSFLTWLVALRHRAPGLRGLLWGQFHFVEALALAAMLRKAKIGRLHSHFANSGATVGMLAAHCLQMPWSLTLHGISETDPPAGSLLPDKLARADFVACASWFMRAQAMRVTPVEFWPKFRIVRCGVELAGMQCPPASDEKEGVHIVTVGRLSAEKGYPGLLEAFARLAGEGIDARLTIIGHGPLRQDLERHVSEHGLADRVRMLGMLPESETLAEISAADIFVLPSLMEGLPVVLMEAMALGKPVIAAWVAGIPELVAEGETGLLFRPGDWSHLADRMRLLMKDRSLWGPISTRARARVEQEFDIEVAVEPLAELFASGEAK
ncbi:MAG: glycosyltransferase [Novosphingobium sp.]